MPELALIFLIGIVFTFIANLIHWFKVHQGFHHPESLMLQQNLLQVKNYWSHANSEIHEINATEDIRLLKQIDLKKSQQATLILMFITTILSWFGLILFTIYTVSVYKIARPRLEQKLFQSELTKTLLPIEKVLEILNSLRSE